MNDRYIAVVREVDVLVAEAASLNASGPQFVIGHRYGRDGICLPGEEVAFVALQYRSRRFVLKLSEAERLLFEALARTSRFAQNAAQIATYMRADQFFAKHGANASRSRPVRGISRTTIKVHVQRLRVALGIALEEAGLHLVPSEVLRTECATGPVGYRLRGTFEWLHIPDGD